MKLIVMLIFVNLFYTPTYIGKNTEEKINKSVGVKISVFKVINFIKSHEGFRNIPYDDGNGNITIGYGQIIKYIPIQYRNYITKEQAEMLIFKKLSYNYSYANSLYPNLNNNQLLAIAHLAYCKGFGSILNHKINEELLNNKVNSSTLLYFGNSEKKYQSYRNNRRFELELLGELAQ